MANRYSKKYVDVELISMHSSCAMRADISDSIRRETDTELWDTIYNDCIGINVMLNVQASITRMTWMHDIAYGVWSVQV